MRREQVGLLAEYVGYLILIAALFQVSNLVGVIGLGAILSFYGIKLRVEGRRSAGGWKERDESATVRSDSLSGEA